jgi:hypothetical protein
LGVIGTSFNDLTTGANLFAYQVSVPASNGSGGVNTLGLYENLPANNPVLKTLRSEKFTTIYKKFNKRLKLLYKKLVLRLDYTVAAPSRPPSNSKK